MPCAPIGWRYSLLILLLGIPGCGTDTAQTDLDSLMSLYKSTNGTRWRKGFTWDKGIRMGLDPCDNLDYFKGIGCTGSKGDSNRRVSDIWLSAMSLVGTIPPDFGNMVFLENIYMTSNNISGQLPESICNLTKLIVFDIAKNNLTGPIPTCVGKMSSLQKWDSRSNFLEGTIPGGFGSLIELQELYLSENLFTGGLPRELFDAKRIEVMFLSYNELQGTVPKVWSRYKIKETPSMQGLSWMDIRANKLEGTYPDIIALLGSV